MLTFVIPVRHPDNSPDWLQLKAKLGQTVAAIAKQDHDAWRGVVVANEGADLPPLPEKFTVIRVDFPPNTIRLSGDANRQAFFESIRADKGSRILAGMLATRDTDYFMVVDDDDFVSDRLAGFVAANHGAPGWSFHTAFVWGEGGNLLYRHPTFHKFCGTSHIVRADLFRLPATFAEADLAYIQRRLGSHIFIDEDLQNEGSPLAPLPFHGAVYRIGHSTASTKSHGVLQTFILKHEYKRQPWRAVREAMRLRWLTSDMKREFFTPDAFRT
ncbi:MAG: galactosyl transferase [Gemmatimonas sp.]